MAGNLAAILSGVAGGGTGNALAWFAPLGTPLPAAADSTLNAAFVDTGWISQDGLNKSYSDSSTDLDAYGSGYPVRVLPTASKATIDLAFLETNKYTLAIFNKLSLASLSPDGAGRINFGEGPIRTVSYAFVANVVDGANVIRYACPNVQVTARQQVPHKAGSGIVYGVTLSAYPGSDGDAIKNLLLVPGLIGT
jgi:hypothetical protein